MRRTINATDTEQAMDVLLCSGSSWWIIRVVSGCIVKGWTDPVLNTPLACQVVPRGFTQKKGLLDRANGVALLAEHSLSMHEAPGFSLQRYKEKRKLQPLSVSWEW